MNLTNIFNPFMIWLLRSPLHKISSRNTLLITFSGRKSGKKSTTPVNYVLDNNAIFITSLRSRTWWKNLRGSAPVSVRLKGQDIETYGEVFEESGKVAEKLKGYLQKVPQYAKYFKVNLDPNGQPNPKDVVQTARERVMILLRLNI